MSATYSPLKGNAGIVKMSLIRKREAGVPIVPIYINNIQINVSNFSEKMTESSLNEEMEDINTDLQKNYFGHRQEISFSVINSPRIPLVSGTTKTIKRCIQEIVQMINAVNLDPRTYRLEIQYRDNYSYGTIQDAIFSGEIELKELSTDSNIAQEFPMTFKSRTTSVPDFGMDSDESVLFILEDNSSNNIILVREDSTPENPKPIILESPAFNVTP